MRRCSVGLVELLDSNNQSRSCQLPCLFLHLLLKQFYSAGLHILCTVTTLVSRDVSALIFSFLIFFLVCLLLLSLKITISALDFLIFEFILLSKAQGIISVLRYLL